MQTITVALDGTEFGEKALVLGARIARESEAQLRLAHVAAEPGYQPETNAAWYVKEVATRLMVNGAVTVEVRVGDPVAELVQLTAGDPDGILIMATHGRGTIGRLVHGSVARDVLLAAKSPVLLVREDTPAEIVEPMTLLVPLDGSALAEAAVQPALGFARLTGASLLLTRVVEPLWLDMSASVEGNIYAAEQFLELETEMIADAKAYLEGIANRLRRQDVHVSWEVRSGRATAEIARLAQTAGADVVVLSTHGRRGVRRLALGSVTDELLHHSDTPLLVIPPGVAGGAQFPVMSTQSISSD